MCLIINDINHWQSSLSTSHRVAKRFQLDILTFLDFEDFYSAFSRKTYSLCWLIPIGLVIPMGSTALWLCLDIAYLKSCTHVYVFFVMFCLLKLPVWDIHNFGKHMEKPDHSWISQYVSGVNFINRPCLSMFIIPNCSWISTQCGAPSYICCFVKL
jgi:hypothetical protein